MNLRQSSTGLSSRTNGVNTLYSVSKEVNWDNIHRLASLDKGQISNKSNNKKDMESNNSKSINKLTKQQKKELTKDQQALMKAGYINGYFNLTEEGKRVLWGILFDEYRDELVKLAQKDIKEAEKLDTPVEFPLK